MCTSWPDQWTTQEYMQVQRQVHMHRAPVSTGAKVPWPSVWATLGYQLCFPVQMIYAGLNKYGYGQGTGEVKCGP